jgi:uncharacterized membrane protein
MEERVMRRTAYLSAALLLVGLLISMPAHSTSYQTSSATYASALRTGAIAVNENGDVLMGAMMDGYRPRTLLWQRDAVPVPILDDLYARDLNIAHEIVGYTANTGTGSHAFLFDSTTSATTDLSIVGEDYSEAVAINDRGQVAINVAFPDRSFSSFVWSRADGFTPVDGLGGPIVELRDINQAGQAAGNGTDGDGWTHAFVWSKASGTVRIGDLGAEWSRANAINEAGQIVGTCGIDEEHYGMFIWDPLRGMSMAWELPYQVQIEIGAINNAGVVVGDIVDNHSERPQHHAFAWSAVGGLTLLGVGGASDVNNRGEIVGDIEGSAVLWEPVPEPSSLLVLGIGLLPLMRALAHRQRR